MTSSSWFSVVTSPWETGSGSLTRDRGADMSPRFSAAPQGWFIQQSSMLTDDDRVLRTFPTTTPSPSGAPSRCLRFVHGTASAAVGAAVVALLYALAVGDPAGRRLDNAIMDAAQAAGRPLHLEFLIVLTAAAPLASVAVLLLVVRAWRQGSGERERAVAVTVIAFGSQVLAQLLKHVLPSPFGQNSLPSGHVTVAVTTLIALVVLVPHLTRSTMTFGIPAVVATGLGTMLVGWHRPSDILAALALVGAVCGLVVAVAAARQGSPTADGAILERRQVVASGGRSD